MVSLNDSAGAAAYRCAPPEAGQELSHGRPDLAAAVEAVPVQPQRAGE
jgi:hypothetical protein